MVIKRVRQLSPGECYPQIVCIANILWVAQSNSSLDRVAFSDDWQTKLGGRFGFYAMRWQVFGFDCYRSPVWGGDQIVKLERGASDNEPGVLRSHGIAGQHPFQEFAQSDVDAGFSLAGLLARHGGSF